MNGDRYKVAEIAPGTVEALGLLPVFLTNSASRIVRVDVHCTEICPAAAASAAELLFQWPVLTEFPIALMVQAGDNGTPAPDLAPEPTAPPPRPKSGLTRISGTAARLLPVLTVASMLITMATGALYFAYHLKLKSRWKVELEHESEDVWFFALKCDVLGLDASLSSDDTLKDLLAQRDCPGALPASPGAGAAGSLLRPQPRSAP